MKLVPALFATAALLGTSAALGAPPAGSPSAQSPAQRCAAERTQMGTPAFKQLYGTNANKANAFGKCVAKVAAAQSQNEQGAAQTCKTEQADTSFAANHAGISAASEQIANALRQMIATSRGTTSAGMLLNW